MQAQRRPCRTLTEPTVSTSASDSDDETTPLTRSKTVPGFIDERLATDYPAGLALRNTFLEFPIERPDMLQLRRTQSAPASPKKAAVDDEAPVEAAAEASLLQGPDMAVAARTQPCALVDGLNLPTIGSARHNLGQCKPCAFAWTSGCGNGYACVFCHLCEPGEKKRRQKEKRANIKAYRSSVGNTSRSRQSFTNRLPKSVASN